MKHHTVNLFLWLRAKSEVQGPNLKFRLACSRWPHLGRGIGL